MPLAYHVIISAYGFWLPNDPRGSWSEEVWADHLRRFGPATKVTTHRSVAGVPHDAALRRAAKQALNYPPVHFSGIQARAVGRGFDAARIEGRYRLHACATLPEHVHLVIAHHERLITRLVGHLKARATQHLAAEGFWPDKDRPVWAQGVWKVFLDTPEAVRRAIQYVEANPLKEGKPRQTWGFVTPLEETP